MFNRKTDEKALNALPLPRSHLCAALLLFVTPIDTALASELQVDLLCKGVSNPVKYSRISTRQGVMSINAAYMTTARHRDLDFVHLKLEQRSREYEYETTDRYIYAVGRGDVMRFFRTPLQISRDSLAEALSATITRLVESEDRSRNPIIFARAEGVILDRSQLGFYELSSFLGYGSPRRDSDEESLCEVVSASYAEQFMEEHIETLMELERFDLSEQQEKHAPKF
ncbi:hypothetical protein [Pararhodobacter sp. SW119]|uniref:hypothetical protein n=1 Tax=Pararhodobacter sp. SW119 TaxID=2780075 RepID=UPI001AE0B165|nr:hypothetical protein [Pararhodobacter sp. SW119]